MTRQVSASPGTAAAAPTPSAFFFSQGVSLEALEQSITDSSAQQRHYRWAQLDEANVAVYEAAAIRDAIANGLREDVMSEIIDVLYSGPGLMVMRAALEVRDVDRVSVSFRELLDEQARGHIQVGDHFAKPGTNARVWLALEKLAFKDPYGFARYYSNDIIALVSQAWLGPLYRVTSALNLVHPGGTAQVPHCDYHLGFVPDKIIAAFNRHIHQMSAMLTLQAAIPHVKMTKQAGPTLYVPFSQVYDYTYLAARNEDVQQWTQAHSVQPELSVGDIIFFNPKVLHAAGSNSTVDVERLANLLQISSAFGRPLERSSNRALCCAIAPTLISVRAGDEFDDEAIRRVIAVISEGYPFPTNLDRQVPGESLMPESEADLMWRAVSEGWDIAKLDDELARLERERS